MKQATQFKRFRKLIEETQKLNSANQETKKDPGTENKKIGNYRSHKK